MESEDTSVSSVVSSDDQMDVGGHEDRSDEEYSESDDTAVEETTASSDLTPNQDGGIIKEIKRRGVGRETPLPGDKVRVHYVGTFPDGSKFDSSRDRNEYFEFDLGKGKVIKAWDIGVASMRKREIAILTCKPEYAYGAQGSGKIPPDSTLVFEIELIDWKGEDISPKHHEGSIIRRLLRKGEGHKHPNDGSVVNAHITGTNNGKVFDDRDVKFIVGEAGDQDIIDGIEHAIKKFKKGEKSRLLIKSKFAFGKEGSEKYSIPSDTDVEYDVEVTDFERAKESWEMDTKEKLEQSEIVKTKGTDFFKDSKYKLAVKQYKKITDYLESETDLSGEEKEKRNALVLAANLNMGICYLKLKSWYEAFKSCDKALEIDKDNVKGIFRRAQARYEMKDYEGSEKDFLQVLELDSSNKAAKNQLLMTRQKLKEQKQKDKLTYFGMFDKFAKIDTKKAEENTQKGRVGKIGEWQNEMADGMMPLDEEAEAFGDDKEEAGSTEENSEKQDGKEKTDVPVEA